MQIQATKQKVLSCCFVQFWTISGEIWQFLAQLAQSSMSSLLSVSGALKKFLMREPHKF